MDSNELRVWSALQWALDTGKVPVECQGSWAEMLRNQVLTADAAACAAAIYSAMAAKEAQEYVVYLTTYIKKLALV